MYGATMVKPSDFIIAYNRATLVAHVSASVNISRYILETGMWYFRKSASTVNDSKYVHLHYKPFLFSRYEIMTGNVKLSVVDCLWERCFESTFSGSKSPEWVRVILFRILQGFIISKLLAEVLVYFMSFSKEYAKYTYQRLGRKQLLYKH